MVKTVHGKAVRTYRTGFRAVLKDVLDQKQVHSLKTYVRVLKYRIGRTYTTTGVRTSLQKMMAAGTVYYKAWVGPQGAEYIVGHTCKTK